MKISTLFKPASLLLGAGLALHSSYGLAAKCEYVVQSDWNSGFVAAIRITNDSTTAINGWSVNWAYTDGSRRTSGWNANVSGNNPYTASGVGWNDRINPGQTVEFGIQGTKGEANGPAQKPTVTGAVCGATSSPPRTSVSSSSRSSSSSSRMTSSSSSFTTTSSSVRTTSSSSSVSSGPNTPPTAVIDTTAHGLTLQVNARDSRDADGHALKHTIDFGDGTIIKYPEAWHTYKQAGDYTVTVTVSDGISEATEVKVVSVQPAAGNKAPIARLVAAIEYHLVRAHGTSSYDEEGASLIYEWDFGAGAYLGEATASAVICGSSSSASSSGDAPRPSAFVTLTVSDGELKDTIQYGAGGKCGAVYDLMPRADFTYSIEGNTVSVDGSLSRDETKFTWDFGDGTTATGLKAKHTYAAPGTYTIGLRLSGPSLFGGTASKTIVIGGGSSVNSSVNSSVPSSSPATSSVISSVYSSQPSSVTTSSTASTTSAISSSVSSAVNVPPVAVVQTADYGLTLHVDARGSTDANGDRLKHTIHFGDGTVITYPEAWHTYKAAGDYTVTVKVSDGITEDIETKVISVQPAAGNRAPIARLTPEFVRTRLLGHAGTSFDLEGSPLTYEWDFGQGAFVGNNTASTMLCNSSSSASSSASPYQRIYGLITLTVSDGELKDTIQREGSGFCGAVVDVFPSAAFTYEVEGSTVSVDASQSRDETGFVWDFGDGNSATGLQAKHTYAAPGTYTVSLKATGPSLFSGTTTKTIIIGGGSSVNSSVNSSVPSSSPATSSVISSVYSSQPSSVTTSSTASTTSAISSSVSSAVNVSPVAVVQTADYGLTLHVDARGSTDANGDKLKHTIDFGDGTVITYPEAWHTYSAPGDYIITVTVSDGLTSATEARLITVQAVQGNQAPIARLVATFSGSLVMAHGRSSYDEEGTPLTYEWDFGSGAFVGDAYASSAVCGSSSSSSSTGTRSPTLVTLTVSDGQLKNTVQKYARGFCGAIYDIVPSADFTYRIEGSRVVVDGSPSADETGFTWDFGDGTTATGLKAAHTYSAPGTYTITLRLSGPTLFGATTSKSVVIAGVASSTASSIQSAAISSSSATTSSAISSSRSSSSRSVSSSVSSATSSDRNHYNAPRANTAPVIDGVADAVWDRASWAPIDVFWLGTQPNPSAQDYTGRYKAIWDEDYLYVLVDVTDDRLYDGVRDPLDRYWEDDTVELFIDENRNGGQHGYNTSAWAYHVSTYLDVVDSTTGGAKLLNDHIDARLVSNGTKHMWELRIRIYGEDYADWKANTPLKLYSGKLMGFSASYIDNDGSAQRESMMGSVNTAGHKNNQGYLDASVFGSMRLVD